MLYRTTFSEVFFPALVERTSGATVEAGQQVEGGSADPKNIQNPEKQMENLVAFVCPKKKRGCGWFRSTSMSVASGTEGGKRRAGQAEVS